MGTESERRWGIPGRDVDQSGLRITFEPREYPRGPVKPAWAERLGLDPEDLQRVAEAAEAYASEALEADERNIRTSDEEEIAGLLRASLLAEAASYRSLLADAALVRMAFGRAAEAYKAIDHEYATVCAVASAGW